MAKQERGLGKGLNAIFGNTSNVDLKKPKSYKTVAETVAEKKQSTVYQENKVNYIDDIERKEQSDITVNTVVSEIPNIETGNKNEGNGEILINLGRIQPDKNQPRTNFDETKLQELADSIKEHGVITPIIVKENGPFYEIIAGERRWRAARLAGLKEIPAIIKNVDEKTGREMSIIENIQRDDLNPVEEALAFQSLIDDYGLTQEEVATRVSKNRSTITNSLRLLKLDAEILDMLKDGSITQGHARALLVIEDKELRKKIADRCAKENLSVREIEALVKLDKLSKDKKNKAITPEAEELQRLKVLYKDLEKKMKAKLGTKVSIVPKNKDKGVLQIEYYSQDDLDRLYMILNSSRDE